MEERIEIPKTDLLAAYNDADEGGKALLEKLYGKAVFMPADIRDRIKTFEDALHELNTRATDGDETAGILLADYESNADNIKSPQTLAYMKLAIVTYALNEGWEPQFTTDEYRYYPWFELFTQNEIDEMDEDAKGRVLGRSYLNASAYAGVAYSGTYVASTYSNTNLGARLCFFKRELAEYAGKQFLDIWADFAFRPAEKKTER